MSGPEYHRRYYEKVLKGRRKKRYQTDAAYRSRVIAGVIARRNKGKPGEPEAVKSDGAEESPLRVATISIRGQDVPVFLIGDLARAVGVSVWTIRAWEAAGRLPRTRLKTGAKLFRRAYTAEMIAAVVAAAETRAGRSPAQMQAEILAEWQGLGMEG